MTDPRAAAVGWVQRALTEVLKSDSDEIRTRAENLVAIAEECRIPFEYLIQWIHLQCPGKEHSSAEFRRYAATYSQARIELLQLRERDPWRRLCPVCHTEVAHRVGSRWRCTRCGDVDLPMPEGEPE